MPDPSQPATHDEKNLRGKLLRVLGGILVSLAILFVLARAWQLRQQLVEGWPGTPAVLSVLAGALAHLIAVYVLMVGYRRLLSWCGAEDVSWSVVRQLYGRTLIGKYLPGNVFHFAGRHVLGRQAGLSHGALAGATLHEALGLAAGAAGLAVVGMVIGGLHDARLSLVAALLILAVAMSAPALLGMARRRFPRLGQLGVPESRPARVATAWLLPAWACHLAFFVLLGMALSVQVGVVVGAPELGHVALVVSSFALAWLAGYVTPGAPAGLGVREALVVALLVTAGISTEAQGITVALLLRLSTTIGDLLVFASCWFGRRPSA